MFPGKGKIKLTTVTIGTNVKTVGANSFAGCSKLKTISIKSQVITKFGKNAFKGIYKKAIIKTPAKKLKTYKKLLSDAKLAKTITVK